MTAAEKVYTPEAAAAALAVKPETIRQWIRSGKLGAVKVGRLWRVRERDLQKFLQTEPVIEYDGDYPVIPCKKVGSELIFLTPCPYCGRKHTHGAGGGGGHRAAHCPDEIKQGRKYIKVPESKRGYILKIVEE
jgi:excisionase family DNA binding protein